MTLRMTSMVLGAAVLAATACHHDRRDWTEQDHMRTTPLNAMPQDRQARSAEDRETVYADRDHDGRVTREEAQIDSGLMRAFDRYDADDDGALDRGEFARLEERSRSQQGAQADGQDTAMESARFEQDDVGDDLGSRSDTPYSRLRARTEYPHPLPAEPR